MFLLLFVCLMHLINGQVDVPGNCPYVNVVQNFREDDFGGYWNPITRYPNRLDSKTRCMSINIYSETPGYMTLNYTGIKTTDNSPLNLQVKVVFLYNSTVGAFVDKVDENKDKFNFKVSVIKVDYKNYCVLWGCHQNATHYNGLAWIFSRERTLSPILLNEALEALEADNLPTKYLREYDQKNCPDE